MSHALTIPGSKHNRKYLFTSTLEKRQVKVVCNRRLSPGSWGRDAVHGPCRCWGRGGAAGRGRAGEAGRVEGLGRGSARGLMRVKTIKEGNVK